MSIISFLLKSKKEMKKEDTKWIKVGKYTLSSHAQNRIVDLKRDLKKKDMLQNLFGKSENSELYKHKDGSIQYDRVNPHNRTLTHIIQQKNVVKSINRYHNNNSSKRQAYKNFKNKGWYCMKKKEKEIFKLSESAILFIKKYAMEELNITSPIDEDKLSEIYSLADEWEQFIIDENGRDKDYDYPEKEKAEMADKFVSELCGQWCSRLFEPDYVDLNQRLGLL